MKFIYGILAIIFISSCDKSKHWPKYTLDQKTLDYCDFEEGTWWVYYESYDDNYDTIEVSSRKFEEMKDPEHSAAFDKITLSLKLTTTNDSIESNLIRRYIIEPDYIYQKNKGLCYLQHVFGTRLGSIAFYSLDSTGEKSTTTGDQDYLKLIRIIPKDTINNIIYEDVMYFDIFTISSGLYARSKFVKNVGMVYYEAFGAKSWELVAHGKK
ncbi:hypothetical protein GYB22_00955 [bacterium]|nr:hypothetical protein [bacterium]